MRPRPVSLRTVAEHRAAVRRARMLNRLAWAGIIIGGVAVLLIPCNPLAGYAC